MDVIRKVNENQSVFLNEDMLNHLGIAKGTHVIVRCDTGKWGNFISIFLPQQEDHKRLLQIEEKKEKESKE